MLQALINANANFASKPGHQRLKTLSVESVPVVATAGVALDAVTKLIGFFKSDFEVRGSDVTADHVLLAKAVAGELLKIPKTESKTLREIYLKGTYNPSSITAVDAVFQAELKGLAFQRTKATSALNELERDILAVQTQLSAIGGNQPQDEQAKHQLGQQLDQDKDSVEQLKVAVAACDSFLSKLIGTEANIAALIRELEFWNALNQPATTLLIVKMEKAGGSNYVEKNVWTSFGIMPFKVMGGVIASYALFEGSSGALLASAIVPIHGGFSKVNKVGKLF
ncbi:MAG: hypothetical protein WKF77_05150 [Planctomycetaceae bacterium]